MTTYQDPPLHSRRAARQGERAAAYGQQPEQQDAEPLTYATQTRPPVPQYEGPDFRARRTPEPSTEPEATTASPAQPEQSGGFRVRDYSPEGRRAASPAAGEPAPTPRAEVASQPIEHTMTRRELRALREAQGLDAAVPQAPAAVPTPAIPSSLAPQPPVATAQPAPESAPAASEPAPVAEPSVPELSPFEALFAAPAQQPVPNFAPDPIAPAPVAEVAGPSAPAQAAPSIEAAPIEAARPAAEVAAPAQAAPAAVEPVAAPPAGHWTTQADLDDATQASESTISRNVGGGSGVITTSALVLPAMPAPEFTKLGTGEVLITGSIDLPHSLATSGAHPQQLDEHHLDHELDPGDHQVSTDSQPVRAVKAVSSHTSTRTMIVAKKPGGNRGLTVLIVAAAAMAAVVVTLLVVGLVTNVL